MRDAEPVKDEKLTARALIARIFGARLVRPNVRFCRDGWCASSDPPPAAPASTADDLFALPVSGAGKNKGGPQPALM